MNLKNIKNKISISYLYFVCIATIIIVILMIAGFNSYPTSNIKDILYIGIQCSIISITTFSFIYIIGLNKYIFTIIYPPLVLVCSVLSYFAWTTNTTLTIMILDATLHNDYNTSADLITTSLIFMMMISVLVAILLCIYRFKKIQENKKYNLLLLFISIIVFLFSNSIQKSKNILSNHIPFNIYYISLDYSKGQKMIATERKSLAQDSFNQTDSLTIVFVIGESLRADHLQLNGYQKNTTPLLSQMENLVSLPNLYTKYTYTNKSLPFILTRADSLSEDIAYTERSFIDIFKHCGWKTSWLANQEPGYTYAYFMHECDTLIYANINKSVYSLDKWLDESLISHYEDRLSLNDNSNRLIILHTIGSHWWYNSHFTDEFELFKPIVKSKIVSSNTKEEMINSYDNTILYTDKFLERLIYKLKKRKAILIYLSDHGESLGENNIWLHASDSPPIHYPAGLIWMSEGYISRYPRKYKALINNSKKKYSESFLFHSILDAGSISSPIMKKELSIFQ